MCRTAVVLTTAVLLALCGPATAGMVGTDRVLDRAGDRVERSELIDALDRASVRAELHALGVDPAQARARVERMTPAEVARLEGRVASLPAGGALSTVELLLIIILIVLLV